MPSDDEIVRSGEHRYRVLRSLGSGGQTRARLVERIGEPDSRYVLKMLRLEHVEDWKQVELFERQVKTLAALDHPGIPRLIDRIEEDGRTAGIVETFVDGHTIAQHIADHGPVSAERFERILRECLEILAYLRERVPPVLHRDINPKNVMLTEDHTYLIDFGAVRVGGKTDMTSVGTFGYMAPEQIIGRAELASDMYGLGMTMVCLAEHRDVGDLPIDPSTGRVDPTSLLKTVEPRVRDVVLGMIEPGLAERLGDPREALRRLDAPPSALATRESTALARGPRSTGRWILLGTGGVAAAVVGIVLSGGKSVAPAPSTLPMSDPQPRVSPPSPPAAPPAPPVNPKPSPPSAPESAPPAPVEVQPIETLTDDNSASVLVTTTPDDVQVFVDGAEACRTPCQVRVSFGRHRLRFVHQGKQVQRDIRVLEDMTVNVALTE